MCSGSVSVIDDASYFPAIQIENFETNIGGCPKGVAQC